MSDFKYSFPIVNDSDISPAFIKANAYLIKNSSILSSEKEALKGQAVLEEMWLAEFRGKLFYDQTVKSWTRIDFDSEQDLTMFLIRWG
jgi:hypothetical protein